jgi:hypothetical protein
MTRTTTNIVESLKSSGFILAILQKGPETTQWQDRIGSNA